MGSITMPDNVVLILAISVNKLWREASGSLAELSSCWGLFRVAMWSVLLKYSDDDMSPIFCCFTSIKQRQRRHKTMLSKAKVDLPQMRASFLIAFTILHVGGKRVPSLPLSCLPYPHDMRKFDTGKVVFCLKWPYLFQHPYFIYKDLFILFLILLNYCQF